MRREVAILAVVLVAAGCHDRAATPPAQPEVGQSLVTTPLPDPSPYVQITAGPVQAVIPDRWDSVVLGDTDSLQEGIMASPRLNRWRALDGTVQGMAAMWIDVARGGIPSDYYYLAASGPVLQGLTANERCRRRYHHVIVDHRPVFDRPQASAGDFVARGGGLCTLQRGKGANRWAYVVAAPGFGPVRQLGIPESGMYMVVAVVRDSPDAAKELRQLLLSTRFGDDTVSELLAAARVSAGQI